MSSIYPMLDPDRFHESCGVGFIFDRSRQRTYQTVRRAVACLKNLDHRGAHAADGTGDGAGIMTRIPYRLLTQHLEAEGLSIPQEGRLGVMTVFLPPGDEDHCRKAIEHTLEQEDLHVLCWREVPVDASALGGLASQTMPVITQALVEAGPSVEEVDGFDARLLLARKSADRRLSADGIAGCAIVSSSCRTVVYKGLFTARHIDDFYWDFLNPAYETDFAIFHQRYSTNTMPSWERAQPFRVLGHNGEINTIQSNRAWMTAREVDFKSGVWGERAADLRPLLRPGKSDSGSLDNAVELLVRSGRSLSHAKEMLIPAAWENVTDLEPSLRDFYEYHAFLTEPWDGPAAIAACDGATLLAAVDRNGLRPARWTVTRDLILVASEAGVVPEAEVEAEATGQLRPGETFTVDLDSGEFAYGDDVKLDVAGGASYGEWIRTETLYVKDPFDDLQDDRFSPEALGRVFGYTAEERRMVLAPMALGEDPLGSMGSDTPLAVLADDAPRLTRFFHQMFAQVTNPAMDPIRERLVMSLRTYLGRRGSLLEETPQQAHLMELSTPVLSVAVVEPLFGSSDPAFRSSWLPMLFDAKDGTEGLVRGLDELCARAEDDVRSGVTLLVLSDRELDAERAPIPAVLAVGAVHHHLIRRGIRLQTSIVVVSGEPRDAHDLACLIGFGASAVNPYMAIEEVRTLSTSGVIDVDPVTAQENYRSALDTGLLKILSKMGICTVSAYRGSELFEAIGLDEDVVDRAFRFVFRRVGGAGYERIASDALSRHALYTDGVEHTGGYYKHRRGGVPHVNGPKAVLALRKAVRSGEQEGWDSYLSEIERSRAPALLRDLLDFHPDQDPVRLAEVEPIERIMRRFTTAAMSHGALSAEAHQALAEAMAFIGGRSNSGEGGEDPDRFGTPRNSAIKQVASGRFGVTPRYLASAEELQIKIAQGSKPGEGGQLPGHKVSPEIARLRHTEPGVTLISPPPHHDIYSIEDLAQLIFDLKTFKPEARVAVKLVSEPGVGTIAVGVVKASADVVTVSGHEGGTGASPLISIKHAGSPWELGVAEAHQALVANGLREKVTLEADGGLRTGRDVIIAALLGADRFGFGTLPLLALGCKMVRQCHENTCPVGIATQDLDLRAKFEGASDHVVQMFRFVAADVRRHLASLGVHSIDEIIGRGDLLRASEPTHPVARELVGLLAHAEVGREARDLQPVDVSPLGSTITEEGKSVITTNKPVELSYPILNTDRAIGTRLAGELTQHLGPEAQLDPDKITIRLSGTAGQSLGAFLTEGISIVLEGPANDYVGKGMGGGRIVIAPSVAGPRPAHGAGNAVLYGATGGELYVAGTVGQRFAVRNSGATAVVEGASDHACEYMTGGVAAILGPIGRNAAAGMTGGLLYLWDPPGVAPRHLADTAPVAVRPIDSELWIFRQLVEDHGLLTGSAVASQIIATWDQTASHVWVVRPTAPAVVDIRVAATSQQPADL